MQLRRIVIGALLTASALSAQDAAPLPVIKQNGAVKQLFVDNRPFIMLSGEMRNSTASSVDDLKPVWDNLSALHLNTVIGTVSWELIEPEEGHFDFTLVDAQINEARHRNMRLVLIWFGTYKTAHSSYVPLLTHIRRRNMQYTLMFYMSPAAFAARTDRNKKAAFWGAFMPYMQAVREAGILKGGVGLEPPESATTIRVQNGKRSVHDGPYADTKEQLGGFCIIEVPDLDTALDWAARYPAGPLYRIAVSGTGESVSNDCR